MKYVFGSLLALVFILGILSLLLNAAATAESLYVSLSQASIAHQVTFAAIVGAAIIGAFALEVSTRPPVDYGD